MARKNKYPRKPPVYSIDPAFLETKKFLGLHLTIPAIIAFIGYIILALVIILPFKYPVVDDNGEEYVVDYDFATRLIILLILAIPIALSVYSINCLMSGQCVVWSYIVALIVVYYIALFVILAFIYTFRKTQEGYDNKKKKHVRFAK